MKKKKNSIVQVLHSIVINILIKFTCVITSICKLTQPVMPAMLIIRLWSISLQRFLFVIVIVYAALPSAIFIVNSQHFYLYQCTCISLVSDKKTMG